MRSVWPDTVRGDASTVSGGRLVDVGVPGKRRGGSGWGLRQNEEGNVENLMLTSVMEGHGRFADGKERAGDGSRAHGDDDALVMFRRRGREHDVEIHEVKMGMCSMVAELHCRRCNQRRERVLLAVLNSKIQPK